MNRKSNTNLFLLCSSCLVFSVWNISVLVDSAVPVVPSASCTWGLKLQITQYRRQEHKLRCCNWKRKSGNSWPFPLWVGPWCDLMLHIAWVYKQQGSTRVEVGYLSKKVVVVVVYLHPTSNAHCGSSFLFHCSLQYFKVIHWKLPKMTGHGLSMQFSVSAANTDTTV